MAAKMTEPALTMNMGRDNARSVVVRLGPAIRTHLGAELRAAYARAQELPLPTEQVELLLALRRKERERRSGP